MSLTRLLRLAAALAAATLTACADTAPPQPQSSDPKWWVNDKQSTFSTNELTEAPAPPPWQPLPAQGPIPLTPTVPKADQ